VIVLLASFAAIAGVISLARPASRLPRGARDASA
jgi:hypothetical protein